MPFRRISNFRAPSSPSSPQPQDTAGAFKAERTGIEPSLSALVAFHAGKELKNAGPGQWMTNCPMPTHEDKNPSFSINDQKGRTGVYYCFGCGESGNGLKFAREVMGKNSWGEAVEAYLSASGIGRGMQGRVNSSRDERVNATTSAMPRNTVRPAATATSVRRLARPQGQQTLPPPKSEADLLYQMSLRHDLYTQIGTAAELFQDSLLNDRILDGISKRPLNEDAKEYLASRKLWKPDPAFKVGYFPEQSRKSYIQYSDTRDMFSKNATTVKEQLFSEFSYLRGRIIFPWCDEGGQVVGLTGRSIGDNRAKGTPKYWNSRNTEIFKKSELLWGHHLAKDAIRNSGELFIVEGYTDVMSLHKAGIKQTVSPIGIAISRAQLEKVFALNNHPLVCLDGDKAGQKASVDVAKRTLQYLEEIGPERARGKSMSFALLPGGKDPDEILREGGVEAFREATSKRLGLREMIKRGENLERQRQANGNRESSSGGVSGAFAVVADTPNQSPGGPRTGATKRSAPEDAGRQPARNRQRVTAVDLDF